MEPEPLPRRSRNDGRLPGLAMCRWRPFGGAATGLQLSKFAETGSSSQISSRFLGGTKQTTAAGYARQGTQIQTCIGRRGARTQVANHEEDSRDVPGGAQGHEHGGPDAAGQSHGLRIESFMIDVLHCADLRSVRPLDWKRIVKIISAKPWANTIEANVSELDKDLNEFTKKDTSRLRGKLTIERIRTTAEWSKLKAKAACTRHLSVYAYHIAQHFNSGSLHDQRREALCKLLCRFYEIIADDTCSCQMTIAKNSKRWAANS